MASKLKLIELLRTYRDRILDTAVDHLISRHSGVAVNPDCMAASKKALMDTLAEAHKHGSVALTECLMAANFNTPSGPMNGQPLTANGVEWMPFIHGHRIGYRVKRLADDAVTFIYLNPSTDSDDDPNVFVYSGERNNPLEDAAVTHLVPQFPAV